MTAATVALPPTPAQVGFLLDLVRERDLPELAGCTPEQAIAKTRAYIEAPGRDRKEISRMIDVAKSAPYRASASASASAASWVIPESVPNSKFALQTEHLIKVPPAWQRQELLFLEVKHLRGKRIMSRLLGAPGRFSRVRVPREAQQEICEALSKDDVAWQAIMRFSDEYSVCGRCGAELTDQDSRDRKLGLWCWKQLQGWSGLPSYVSLP